MDKAYLKDNHHTNRNNNFNFDSYYGLPINNNQRITLWKKNNNNNGEPKFKLFMRRLDFLKLHQTEEIKQYFENQTDIIENFLDESKFEYNRRDIKSMIFYLK